LKPAEAGCRQGRTKNYFVAGSRQRAFGVELYIGDGDSVFHDLVANRENIESDLGMTLDWRELPDKKASRILITRNGNFQDDMQVDDLIGWLVRTADEFARVFPKYM